MDLEARAGDLLERLEDLGMAADLIEEDLYGKNVREPFCKCCNQLARAFTLLPEGQNLVDDPGQLKAAAQSLHAASVSQKDAVNGKLDAALAALCQAIQPTAADSSCRVVQLELAIAHLQAARIIAHKQQQHGCDTAAAAAASEAPSVALADMQIDDSTESGSMQLRMLAKLLGIDASHSTALSALSDLLPAAEAVVRQLPGDFFSPVADMSSLDGGQMDILREVDQALHNEYTIRRCMLIERIKVTLQSFLWSPRIAEKGTRAEVEALIAQCQAQLHESPSVSLSDVSRVTAADLATVLKRATSGAAGTVDASVKRVLIGKVPDRGGRPEGRSREANMPDWAPRRQDSGTGGRGGGGGGGGGGGRGQQQKRGRGGAGGYHRGGTGGGWQGDRGQQQQQHGGGGGRGVGGQGDVHRGQQQQQGGSGWGGGGGRGRGGGGAPQGGGQGRRGGWGRGGRY